MKLTAADLLEFGVIDGIISGFSSSNYMTLPYLFHPGTAEWEMVMKFKVYSQPSQYASYVLLGDSNSTKHSIKYYINMKYGTKNKCYLAAFLCSAENIDWDIAAYADHDNDPISVNVDTWFKLEYKNL